MTSQSSTEPRSPLYGTTTFSTFSPTETLMSPSRLSYTTRSDTRADTEDTRELGRTIPSHTNSDTYSDDNSFDEEGEVEAALNIVDSELDNTEDVLSEWSRPSGSGTGVSPPSNSSGSYVSSSSYSYSDPYPIPNTSVDRKRLSTISERSENTRPPSHAFVSSRPANPTPDALRRSTNLVSPSSHSRASTESNIQPLPSRRAGDLIAFFEDKTTDLTHSRTASAGAARSSSPFTQSQSTPVFGTYGYNSSRPSSPSKSGTRTSSSSSGSASHSMTSLLSPPGMRALTATSGMETRTATTTGGYLSPTTFTDTLSNTFPTSTSQSVMTPTQTGTSSLRRPLPHSPQSSLTSVRNVVAAWKERTPSRSSATPTSATASGDGLFSVRRRAERRSGGSSNGRESSDTGSGRAEVSSFDVAELSGYAGARGSQEPLRIGLLWYLNVHAPPPYRWQRCQALLYPHMILLSWIAPGGGRGIVTLDLLNCTEVRSVPSPTHQSAREDVGTIAAREQSGHVEGDREGLMEILCPFQLLYGDGVERLAAESARERVRWVSAIWEALDRSVTLPERSVTRSPVGSIRTIRSESSTHSGSGSSTTVFVPPHEVIPDISDLQSISGSSSRSLTGVTQLASAHHARSTDDAGVSNQAYLYPGDPRVIAPSRSSSLRRTSSLTDLDQEFASAVSRPSSGTSSLGITPELLQRSSNAASLLSDSHDPFTPTSPPRTITTPLSRTREVRRRTPRSSSRTYSSSYSASDESSDKENSGRSYTPTRSTSGSYTPLGTTSGSYSPSRSGSGSYTPTPSSGKSELDVCQTSSLSDLTPRTWTTSSSGTPGPSSSSSSSSGRHSMGSRYVPTSAKTSYTTARSHSTASYESLPTIPSDSDDGIPEEGSSGYVTASVCSTPQESTEYVTASICSTPQESTEYATASICSTPQGSTEYITASICSTTELAQIPSEMGSAHDRDMEAGSEASEESIVKAPSVVPSIPSVSTPYQDPAGIPLPPSSYAMTASSTPSLGSSYPPSSSTPEVSHIPDVPSPLPSGVSESSGLPISTESSILSYSESTIPPPSPQLTVYSESTYDSTMLQASSPSVMTAPLHQGLDTSFNTSFLRPSSALSSLDQLPTIPETPTAPSSTIPSSASQMLSSPSSLSYSTTIGDLSRTTSSVSSLRSSIFDSRSLVDFEEPSTVPSLLSARSPLMTPTMIPLPSSPSITTPAPSVSVSISTPHSNIPSVRTDLDTVSSRSEPLSRGISRVLDRLNDLDRDRGMENRDLADNVRAIRDELADLSHFLRGRPPPVPKKDPSLSRTSTSLGLGQDRAIAVREPRGRPLYPSSPSSMTSSISFMSSHHSDDYSLMDSEPYPGPGWPPSSSPSSSPTSPPSSPTPSTTSDATVRPRDLEDIRDILNQIRDRGEALWNGQGSTNDMLDDLRGRRPITPDDTGLMDRLQRLEDLIQQILDQPRGQPIDEPPLFEGSDGLTDIDSLRRRWDDLNRARGGRPPVQPTPIRPGRSLSDQLADMLAAGPQIPPPGVEPPQPIVTIVHHPQRPDYESDSPILPDLRLPPRPHTVPVRFEPSGRRIPRIPRSEFPRPGDVRAPPPQPPAEPVIPPLHRQTTAPPHLGGPGGRFSTPWYLPRPGPEPIHDQPSDVPPAPQGGQTFVPMPAGPTVVEVPLFDTLTAILRENRLAQMATVDQQRELMRYMRGLNEWLERDVHDRQAELRGVSARIDQLRNDLGRFGSQGQAPVGQFDASRGGLPPGFQPISFSSTDQPSRPVIPPVIPPFRTPQMHTPVIPPTPMDLHDRPMGPEPPRHGPFIPPRMGPSRRSRSRSRSSSRSSPSEERIFIPSQGQPGPPIVIGPPPMPGPPMVGQMPTVIPIQRSDSGSTSTTGSSRTQHLIPVVHSQPTMRPSSPRHTDAPQPTVINVGAQPQPGMGGVGQPVVVGPGPGVPSYPVDDGTRIIQVPTSRRSRSRRGRSRSRSRSRSPVYIRDRSRSYSRSRSRTPERVVVVPTGRSEGRGQVVIQPPHSHRSRSRSHSPRRLQRTRTTSQPTAPMVVNVPTGQGPTAIPVVDYSRSHSRERPIIVGSHGHSRRSRSPRYYSREGDRRRSPRRSRSYSPRRSRSYSPYRRRRRRRHYSRSYSSDSSDGRYRRRGGRGYRGYSPYSDRSRRHYHSYSPSDRYRRRRSDEGTRIVAVPGVSRRSPTRRGSPTILMPPEPGMYPEHAPPRTSHRVVTIPSRTRGRSRTPSPGFRPVSGDERDAGGARSRIPSPGFRPISGDERDAGGARSRIPSPGFRPVSGDQRDAGGVPRPHRLRTPVSERLPYDPRDGGSVPPAQPFTGRPVPVTEAGIPYAGTERRTPPISYHIPPPTVPGDQRYGDAADPERLPPGDQRYGDAADPERQRYGDAADPEHLARIRGAEDRLLNAAQEAAENEDRRDQNFQEHEEERQRIFLENEQRREQEAGQRRDEIWQDLEQRMGGPPQVVQAVPDDARSTIGSVRTTAQDAASRHPDVSEADRAEREAAAHERELAHAERARLHADAEAERALHNQEREARIQALEDELAAARAELSNERQQRATEAAEGLERQRQEALERDEGIRNQLEDITNLIHGQSEACARKKELMDERWEESQARRVDKDARCQELRDMVAKILEDREADRLRADEERLANEGRPGIDKVLEELAKQNAEQQELLNNLSDNWRADSTRQHQETIDAVRATAQEQVPFNVQGYLDDFSKALASEVRMLLGEVGKLREERRSLQYELGYLMCMKSKYGPGGEFDPDWRPPTRGPGGPPPDGPQPPELPEEPVTAKPGWRSVRPGRKQKKKQDAPPPHATPGPEPRQSWATWQPDPNMAPTPPSHEPTLLVPERGSPGLFGPRSPRDSFREN